MVGTGVGATQGTDGGHNAVISGLQGSGFEAGFRVSGVSLFLSRGLFCLACRVCVEGE